MSEKMSSWQLPIFTFVILAIGIMLGVMITATEYNPNAPKRFTPGAKPVPTTATDYGAFLIADYDEQGPGKPSWHRARVAGVPAWTHEEADNHFRRDDPNVMILEEEWVRRFGYQAELKDIKAAPSCCIPNGKLVDENSRDFIIEFEVRPSIEEAAPAPEYVGDAPPAEFREVGTGKTLNPIEELEEKLRSEGWTITRNPPDDSESADSTAEDGP